MVVWSCSDGRDWIATDEFSAADIMIAGVLRYVRKGDQMTPYPRITAYYARDVRGASRRTHRFDSVGRGVLSKVLDPKFKPKFAVRSLQCCAGKNGSTRHIRGRSFLGTNDVLSDVRFPWPGGSMKIQTGMITKLKKDGDDTTINFKGTVVNGCVKWVETKKIRTEKDPDL